MARPSTSCALALVRAIAVVGACLLGLTGCRAAGDADSEAGSKVPRLVLVYAPCTVATTHLSPYAPQVDWTPNLAAFAAEGQVFTRHQTESGQSGTAYASLLTGTQAVHHGVFHHPSALAGDVDTFGHVFADADLEVEMWLGHIMASAELGYGRGAEDHVHDSILTPTDPSFVRVLERLRAEPDARAFVFASFTLTHAPYRVESLTPFCARHPARCAERAADPQRFEAAAGFYLNHHLELAHDFPSVAAEYGLEGEKLAYLARVVDLLYSANVSYLDHYFGTVLQAIDAAGLRSESLVVFTADHGETMFREGTRFKWSHGHQLAPEVLQVPFVARGPGVEPGRYEGVSRSIDVLPTVAAWAGVPRPERGESDERTVGIDLGPVLRGTRDAPVAWSHTTLLPKVWIDGSRHWLEFYRQFPDDDPRRIWAQQRDGDLVVQVRTLPAAPGEPIETVPKVFDLASDPHQLRDLYDPNDPDHHRRVDEVRAYRQQLIGAYEQRTEEAGVDEEAQREMLRELGYIE